jgi:hypothetical protein
MTQYAPGGEPASTGAPTSGGSAASSAQSAKERATEAAQTGKQAGAEVAQQASQAGTQVAQSAAERAKDVAHETQRQARDLFGEAKQQLQNQASSQHSSLVSNIRQLGDELGGMTSSTGQSGIASELVSQAHERVNSVADWLEHRQPGDLVTEVRRFAQRRPGAFLLGAAVAGVVAGRLTRGVVAAHSEDDATSGIGSRGSGEYTEIQGGYSSGYTPTTTYGETSGYGSAGYPAESDPYAAQRSGGAFPGADPYGGAQYGEVPAGGQYGGTGYPGVPADPGYSVPPSGGTSR